ncbi:MAG: DNA polymerase III subunit delta' [Chloroflexota bacterium]
MNWEMCGHEWAVNLLAEHVARGRMRHAYLFTGPQGVGRRTLALRLAQALNCLEPPAPGAPCLSCRTCKQIDRMEHADLAVVQAEQIGGTLRVDQVRELQRSLALAPYQARYRVAILLRFEEANASAMNALLKTLEEPASQVVLILTAESAENLLPTIVSRCEVLRLRPLPLGQVEQDLQTRWGMPEEQARLLAHLSGGRPGYAFRLYQEPERLALQSSWLDDLSQLLSAKRVDRFAYAEKMAKDKDTCRAMLSVWLAFWRDVLLKSSGAAAPVANLDRQEQIEHLAEQFGMQVAYHVVTVLDRALALLDCNVNLRLAAETLLLDLPYR